MGVQIAQEALDANIKNARVSAELLIVERGFEKLPMLLQLFGSAAGENAFLDNCGGQIQLGGRGAQ